MASKRAVQSKMPAKDLPPEIRNKKFIRPPKEGKLPLSLIFDSIYQRVATSEAKTLAPQDLAELKTHLDGALRQIQAVSDKIKASQPK